MKATYRGDAPATHAGRWTSLQTARSLPVCSTSTSSDGSAFIDSGGCAKTADSPFSRTQSARAVVADLAVDALLDRDTIDLPVLRELAVEAYDAGPPVTFTYLLETVT